MNRILSRAAALGTLALLGVGNVNPASAQSIGINFTGGTQKLAATDQPGIVPGANFNNVIGGGGTTLSGLVDSSGAATAASVSVNSGGTYDAYTVPTTSNAATNTMYSGGLFGLGDGGANAEVSVTLTNIPYATYSVYVYSSEDTAGSTTPVLSDTIGATTFYYGSDGTLNSSASSLLQTTSTNPLNPTRGPAQYQLFTGLSGSSFTLTTAGSITGIISNNVFGLQIVSPAATPEPGSVALLIGLSASGAGFLARRRKNARQAE